MRAATEDFWEGNLESAEHSHQPKPIQHFAIQLVGLSRNRWKGVHALPTPVDSLHISSFKSISTSHVLAHSRDNRAGIPVRTKRLRSISDPDENDACVQRVHLDLCRTTKFSHYFERDVHAAQPSKLKDENIEPFFIQSLLASRNSCQRCIVES